MALLLGEKKLKYEKSSLDVGVLRRRHIVAAAVGLETLLRADATLSKRLCYVSKRREQRTK